jgi:hypothetical protein
LTDKRAKSGTPFRLFGTASVGGQSITGIPRLYQLRNEPKLAPRSTVWPFETGWAIKASWLPKHISIVHAEIYPSVREPKPDPIKDRGQVHAAWEWARDLDRQDQLGYESKAGSLARRPPSDLSEPLARVGPGCIRAMVLAACADSFGDASAKPFFG